MKKWSNPEMKELNLANTEGICIGGTIPDGKKATIDGEEVKLTSDHGPNC